MSTLVKPVGHAPKKPPGFDAAAQWARLALPPISPTRQLSSSLPTIACNLSAERRREHCAHATIHKPVAWRIATCARGEPCAQLLPGRALRCAGRGRNAGFLFLPQRAPSSNMARRLPSGHLGLNTIREGATASGHHPDARRLPEAKWCTTPRLHVGLNAAYMALHENGTPRPRDQKNVTTPKAT